MNGESRLFRELSKDQIEEILFFHFQEAGSGYSLLEGGMFNTTYSVTLSGGKRYVLRVGPVNRHLLLPFETALMTSEKWFYQLCAGKNVPVPKVVACVTDQKRIDRDYMITEYIDSVCLNSEKISTREKQKLYFELGNITANFHAIEGRQFGRVSDVMTGRGYESWGRYLRSEFSQTVERLKPYRLFDGGILDKIEQIPVVYGEVLNDIQKAQLVHADLWEGNVLISPSHRRVAAVIDADRGLFGDAAYEFAGGWMKSDAFFAGYGKVDLGHPRAALRQKIYRLLYRLIDTYVYFVEYNDTENGDQTRKIVLELAAEL